MASAALLVHASDERDRHAERGRNHRASQRPARRGTEVHLGLRPPNSSTLIVVSMRATTAEPSDQAFTPVRTRSSSAVVCADNLGGRALSTIVIPAAYLLMRGRRLPQDAK